MDITFAQKTVEIQPKIDKQVSNIEVENITWNPNTNSVLVNLATGKVYEAYNESNFDIEFPSKIQAKLEADFADMDILKEVV